MRGGREPGAKKTVMSGGGWVLRMCSMTSELQIVTGIAENV